MTGNFRNFSFPHLPSNTNSRGMWESECKQIGMHTNSYIKNSRLYESIETPTIYDYEAISDHTPRNYYPQNMVSKMPNYKFSPQTRELIWFDIANEEEIEYISNNRDKLEETLDFIYIAKDVVTGNLCNTSNIDPNKKYKLILGINRERFNKEKDKMDMELKTIVDKKLLELVYDSLTLDIYKLYNNNDYNNKLSVYLDKEMRYVCFDETRFQNKLADLLVGLKVLDEDLYNKCIKEKAIKNYKVNNDEE